MITAVVAAVVLWQAPGELRVPNSTSQSVRLPALTGPARLVFRARAEFPRRAGSTYLLGVNVGGREVGPMADRHTSRQSDEATRQERDLPRYDAGRWRVAYAPAASDDDTFALAVGDLLAADAPTLVTFTNGLAATPEPSPLVIESLRLEVDGDTPRRAPAPPPDWRTPRLRPPPAPQFEVEADATSVRVRWAGHDAVVRTTVAGGPRRWERALVRRPTHVEVRDTITNDADTVIGLHIRHAVATAEPWVHLAGRPDPALTDAYAPWNPTAFTPIGAGGLGLVAEDDVLRQQLHVDYERGGFEGTPPATIGLRTDMLCLAPHDAVTLVWSVYPLASRNYWDFANAVRSDWGVNRTVPGSLVWFKPDQILAMPDDRLRDALARARVGIASMSGGWVDPRDDTRPPHLGFGTDVAGPRFAAFRARIRHAVARLKAARPEMRVLIYFDAQRESATDAPSRFDDSLLHDPSGRPERTEWDGRFSPSWSMVPTADNTFGRALTAAAATLGDLGADGLYWDEIDGIDYAAPRLTVEAWDERSCVLAADGTVRTRIGLTNLLSAPVKRAIAAVAGTILANGPPTTRAFQDRDDLHMIEAQHNDAWGAFAHLSTPLGYVGSAGLDVATLVRKIDEGLLVAGLGLGEHADLLAHLFPFTPEYIQPGTVRGRERIVTTESGTHGWTEGGGTLRGWRYTSDGRLAPAPWRVKERHGALFVRVRLGPGEIAVVERARAIADSHERESSRCCPS
jgi:hypothetical protein